MAAVKTSAPTQDPITTTAPLIGLVARDPVSGVFSFHEYSPNTDKDTRPILVVNEADNSAYVFVTGKEGGSKICYKSIGIDMLDDLPVENFPDKRDCGESFIEDDSYKFINNATSMKQHANASTGIAVMASGRITTTEPIDDFYMHNVLGDPAPVVTARTPNFEQVGVVLTTTVRATFNKPMNAATLTATSFKLQSAAGDVTGNVAYDAGSRTAVFTPDAPLAANTRYTATLTNDVTDTSDPARRLNEFDGSAAGSVVEQWSFTTASGTVQFALGSYSVNEVAGSATITVVATPASAQPVLVTYATSDGTATAGSDYTARTETLTFNPGQTVATFTIPITDDLTVENQETVTLTLSSPVSATLGTPAVATLIIIDDEGDPVVQFDPTSIVVAENVAGSQALVNVSLSRAHSETVTVNYATANGTAIADEDYTEASGTLTFAPGDTSEHIIVPIINDTVDELDETVQLSLNSPTNAILGTLGDQATLTITDDDAPPTVKFESATYNLPEGGGNITVVATLSSASSHVVTVDYAITDGTATLDDDYTATSTAGTLTFDPGQTSKNIIVTIVNDDRDESDETVNVALSNPSNATLATPFSAVLTIEDNDAPPSVAFASAATSKGEGSGTAEITVRLSAPSGQVVSVDYANAGGTATPDSDYGAVSGTLLFAPGQTTAVIELAILNDDAREPDETVILNLSAPSNATLGTPASMTLTIQDNDPNAAVSVQFSSNNYSRSEGSGGATITVQLSAASGETVTVKYATSNGTATAGSDYTAVNGTLTFAPGETSKNFTVPIVNDGADENNETVNLTLSEPSNASLGSFKTATLIIEDNDTPENPNEGFQMSLPQVCKN
jgi:hypothetical protein